MIWLPGEVALLSRPLVAVAVSYVAGIGLGRFWLEKPGPALWLAALVLLLGLGAVRRRWLGAAPAVLLAVFAVAGGISYAAAVSPAPGGLLDYAGSFVTVEGTVVEEPQHLDDHSAYHLRVEAVETKEGRVPLEGTLLVKIYGDREESYWFGERLRLRANIIEPKERRNPGGFDYRFYLRSQGVDALAYPKAYQVSSLGPGDPGRLPALAATLRGRMVEGIEANLPSPPAELLTAILFGQRHRLPTAIQGNFTRSGTGHLMAVSGLHVGLVAALILGLWRRLGLRGGLPLVLAILIIFGYTYLTGLSPSAVRAAIMLSLALGAVLLDRERDIPTAIALATLATLAVNPLLLFNAGFQLSYAATLAIIYLTPPVTAVLARLRVPALLRALAAVTLSAQLGVLPLCAYHFMHLPLASLFFNLLLLPLMVPLAGLGLSGAVLYLVAPPLAAPLFWATRPLLEFMLALTGLSARPGFYLPVYPPGPAALALLYVLPAAGLWFYYRLRSQAARASPVPGATAPAFTQQVKMFTAALFSRFKPRPASLMLIVLLLALLLVYSGIIFPASDDLTVTFIDVGQGASVLVQCPDGAAILIDGGGISASQGHPGEVGEQILLPFLRHQGIRRLDLVVITHPHEDHFGGLLPLLGAIPVSRLLISPAGGDSPYYLELLKQAEALGIPIPKGYSGQRWACSSGLELEILHPQQKAVWGSGDDLNNSSMVLRLAYGSVRFLFTGDIRKEAVQELLRLNRSMLKADVFQVPHHGGQLDNLPELLRAVNPRVAVIPVGVNSFGHPHPSTLEALAEAGVAVYRNDLHGAVIIRTTGNDMHIETMLCDNGDGAILSQLVGLGPRKELPW